jgi:hypothetical protein
MRGNKDASVEADLEAEKKLNRSRKDREGIYCFAFGANAGVLNSKIIHAGVAYSPHQPSRSLRLLFKLLFPITAMPVYE